MPKDPKHKKPAKKSQRSNPPYDGGDGVHVLSSPIVASTGSFAEAPLPEIIGIKDEKVSHTCLLHDLLWEGFPNLEQVDGVADHQSLPKRLVGQKESEDALGKRVLKRLADLHHLKLDEDGTSEAYELNGRQRSEGKEKDIILLFPGSSPGVEGMPSSSNVLAAFEPLLPKAPVLEHPKVSLMKHGHGGVSPAPPLPQFPMAYQSKSNQPSVSSQPLTRYEAFLSSDEVLKLKAHADPLGSQLASSSSASPVTVHSMNMNPVLKKSINLSGLAGIPPRASTALSDRLSGLLLIFSHRLLGLFDYVMAAGAERHRLLLTRARYQSAPPPEADLPTDEDVFLVSKEAEEGEGDEANDNDVEEPGKKSAKQHTTASTAYLQFAVTFADEWREMVSSACPELAAPLEALGPLFTFVACQVISAHSRVAYEHGRGKRVEELQAEIDRSGISRLKALAASEIDRHKAKITALEKQCEVLDNEVKKTRLALVNEQEDRARDHQLASITQQQPQQTLQSQHAHKDISETGLPTTSANLSYIIDANTDVSKLLAQQQDVIELLRGRLAAMQKENDDLKKGYESLKTLNASSGQDMSVQTCPGEYLLHMATQTDQPLKTRNRATSTTNHETAQKADLSPLSPPIMVSLPSPQQIQPVQHQPSNPGSTVLNRTLQGIYEQQQRMYSDSVAALNSCSQSQQDTRTTASSSVCSHGAYQTHNQHSSSIVPGSQASHTHAFSPANGSGVITANARIVSPGGGSHFGSSVSVKGKEHPSMARDLLNPELGSIGRRSDAGESRHSLSENAHMAASQSIGGKSLAASVSTGRLLTPNTSREVIAQGVVTSVLFSAGVPVGREDDIAGVAGSTLVGRPEESIEALGTHTHPHQALDEIWPATPNAKASTISPAVESMLPKPASRDKGGSIGTLVKSLLLDKAERAPSTRHIQTPVGGAMSASLITRAVASRERVTTALPHDPSELFPRSPRRQGNIPGEKNSSQDGFETVSAVPPTPSGCGDKQPSVSSPSVLDSFELKALVSITAVPPVTQPATLELRHRPRGVLRPAPSEEERKIDLNTMKVQGVNQQRGGVSLLSPLSSRPVPPLIPVPPLMANSSSPRNISGRPLALGGNTPRTARNQALPPLPLQTSGSLSANNSPRRAVDSEQASLSTEWKSFWEDKDRKQKEKERLEILAMEKKLLQSTLARLEPSSNSPLATKLKAVEEEKQTRQQVREALKNFNSGGQAKARSVEAIMAIGRPKISTSPGLPHIAPTTSEPTAPHLAPFKVSRSEPQHPPDSGRLSPNSTSRTHQRAPSPQQLATPPPLMRYRTDWSKVAGGDALAMGQYMAYLDSICSEVGC